jgi:predicted DNA-binding transcriptional regulator AlpA
MQTQQTRRCEKWLANGTQCRRNVREGQTHCRAHGGTPAVTKRTRASVELPLGLEPRVTIPQLAAALGTTPTTIWRMRRRGELPDPDRLTPGHPTYGLSTVRRIIADREAVSRGQAAASRSGQPDAAVAAR